MNRGVARDITFWSDADRIEFGRLLGESSDRTDVEVHAYCLMPNHYHLVLHCPEGGLSEFVQHLASVYTRHANERIGRDGPIFRGRFRSRAIDRDRYLLSAVRYVHRNPLALVGVDDAASYRWSSHRAYLELRRRPPWLRTDVVLGLLGDDRETYGRFVMSDRGDKPGRVEARTLDEAVWLAIDEADESGRAPQGLALTVGHLVRDLLAPGATSPALRRARRQARSNPATLAIARRATELL